MLQDTYVCFHFQVAELTAAAKAKYGAKQGLEQALFVLREALMAAPARRVTATSMADGDVSGLLPLSGAHFTEVELDFQPPSRVDIVGSYLLRTVTRSAQNVDVAVEIPSACLAKKDELNFQYHDKRALFLGALAQTIRADEKCSDTFEEVSLSCFGRDARKPILLLRPSNKARKWTIRILPVVADDAFDARRLVPGRNNVRLAAVRRMLAGAAAAEEAGSESAMGPPTPSYNASILEDAFMRTQLATMHEQLQRCPAAVSALIVLKEWLHRVHHGSPAPEDGVNGFLLSAIVVALLQAREVSSSMESHQLVRAVLKWLAEHPLTSTPIVVAPASGDDAESEDDAPTVAAKAKARRRGAGKAGPGVWQVSEETLDQYLDAYDVVILGPSHELNLASRVSASAASLLQRHAAAASAALQAASGVGRGSASAGYTGENPLDALARAFVQPLPPASSYFDRVVAVELPSEPPSADDASEADLVGLSDAPWGTVMRRRAAAILRQALGDRAELVALVAPTAEEDEVVWPADEPRPADGRVRIGVLLNPARAHSILDRGPAADDEAACAAFKAFWGEKSELRRFQDGAIIEAVVWDSIPVGRRAAVVPSIARYALERHLPVLGDVEVPSDVFDLLSNPPGREPCQTATTKALAAFEHLASTLRDAKGLPLAVSGVQHAHPALRYTAVQSIAPHPLLGADPSVRAAAASAGVSVANQCVVALDVVITLQSSARWPDDLEAIRKTKTAFYLRIADVLRKSKGLRSVASRDCLDVFVAGYAFRLRIHHERELSLLRRAAAAAGDSALMLSRYGGVGVVGAAAAVPEAVDPAAVGFVNVAPVAKDAPAPAPNLKAKIAKRRREAARAGHAEDSDSDDADGATIRYASREARRADALHRRLVAAPRHSQEIHSVATSHPVFGPTCRLAQRWLAAHLLADHIPIEAVELLCAHVFVHPHPCGPPRSAAAGLLRFLALLGGHDWAAAPLLVDVSGAAPGGAAGGDGLSAAEVAADANAATSAAVAAEASSKSRRGPGSGAAAADRRALEARFSAARRRGRDGVGGGPAMFLVTPHERGVWRPQWTESTPSTVVLARASLFARRSAGIVAAWLHAPGGSEQQVSWQSAFTTPAGDFDAFIRLRGRRVPRCDGLAFGDVCDRIPTEMPLLGPPDADTDEQGAHYTVSLARNLSKSSRASLLVGVDPVAKFVSEIRRRFGSKLLAFRNPLANDVIALVWRRDAAADTKCAADLGVLRRLADAKEPSRKAKRARSGSAEEAADGAADPTTDLCSVLGEVAALGGPLVDKVHLA